jgi:SSS family solute:Na+ symporter
VVIIGILTFVLAYSVVGILKTLFIALSLTSAFILTMLFTLFKPSMCRRSSASATIIAGILTLVV